MSELSRDSTCPLRVKDGINCRDRFKHYLSSEGDQKPLNPNCPSIIVSLPGFFIWNKTDSRPYKLLTSLGIDPNVTDQWNRTLLHYLAYYDLLESFTEVQGQIKNFEVIDIFGDSPLALAAHGGALRMCQVLCDLGADPHRIEREDSLLHKAVESRNSEVVRFFIKKGLALNHRGLDGETPLHRASWYENEKVFVLLLSYGPDLSVEDEHKCTPLERLRMHRIYAEEEEREGEKEVDEKEEES